MAGVSEQDDAVRWVDPGLQGLAVHESPLECRVDKAQYLAEAEGVNK